MEKTAYASTAALDGGLHATAVPDTPPISQAVARLERYSDDLHNMISALEARLESILSPSKPEPSDALATATHSPLHHSLSSLADRVVYADERIGRLIDRLTI